MTRCTGTITSWNDARGFGFIQADQGGPEIFAHIQDFPTGRGRPQAGQRVRFAVEAGRAGKQRASNIVLVSAARAPRVSAPRAARQAPPRETPEPWSTASALAIPAFALVYAAVATLWHVPAWVAALYGAASLLCFGAYALDKSAATAGRRRTPERTLLLLGLVGGWPGALLAQQLLRHKTRKTRFRVAFWATVALNVLAFVALLAPLGQAWRA